MENKTYTPELAPRQGEYTAWGLALFSLVGLAILQFSGFSSWIVNFFVGFLFFAALSITLGNWMDRRTLLSLGAGGLTYTNGLRKVHLDWHTIHEVRVLPGQVGVTVQVIGGKSHFEFKTLGEMKYEGQTRMRTGFADGERILDVILARTGLVEVAQSGFTRYVRP